MTLRPLAQVALTYLLSTRLQGKQWDGRPRFLTASMCQSGKVTDHS